LAATTLSCQQAQKKLVKALSGFKLAKKYSFIENNIAGDMMNQFCYNGILYQHSKNNCCEKNRMGIRSRQFARILF
jgi:hypothetical protein